MPAFSGGGRADAIRRETSPGADLTEAVRGQAVTLTLTDEVDVSRGDVLCRAESPAEVADQFEAHIVWMNEQPMLAGRPYLLKSGTRTVGCYDTALCR